MASPVTFPERELIALIDARIAEVWTVIKVVVEPIGSEVTMLSPDGEFDSVLLGPVAALHAYSALKGPRKCGAK